MPPRSKIIRDWPLPASDSSIRFACCASATGASLMRHDHVARLDPEAAGNGLRYGRNERALTVANVAFGANRRRQRNELELLEHGDALRIHLGEVRDFHLRLDLPSRAPHHDRDDVVDVQFEQLGVPVVRVLDHAIARANEHVTGEQPRLRRRRPGHHFVNRRAGVQRVARERRLLRVFHFHADPWLADLAVDQQIVGHAPRAVDRDREAKPDAPTARAR